MKTLKTFIYPILLIAFIAGLFTDLHAQRAQKSLIDIEPPTDNLPTVYIDEGGAKGTLLYVSKDEYNDIREWMTTSNQSVKLSQYLNARHTSAEVDTFMKRYFGGDHSYFTGAATGSGKGGGKGGTSSKITSDCKCKFLTVEPGSSITVDPPSDTQLPIITTSSSEHQTMLFRRLMGAGRAEFGWARSWEGKDLTLSQGTFDLDAKAVMKIAYLCTDEDELPAENCGCEKTIHTEGEVRGTLYAHSDGGGWVGYDAAGRSEAAAFMASYMYGNSVSALEITGAKMKYAENTSSGSINQEFVNSLVGLAGSIIGIFTAEAGSAAGLLPDAISSLGNLIGQDPYESQTTAASPVSLNQVWGANLILKPLQEQIIILGTQTAFSQTTKTRDLWVGSSWAEAYGAYGTAYRLHAFLNYDNSDPDCCTEKYGMWAYGGYSTSVTNNVFSFTPSQSSPEVAAMKNNLVSNFTGPWDSFNPSNHWGVTGSNAQTCECNVKAGVTLVTDSCHNVTIDISNSQFATDYFVEILDLDDDCNFAGSGYQGWHYPLPNTFNLASPNSPLGFAYNFEAGHKYSIKIAVSGHCTGWDSEVISCFEVKGKTTANLEVLNVECDNVIISTAGTANYDEYHLSVHRTTNTGVYLGNYKSTGWITPPPALATTINLASPTSILGGYNFVADTYYKIRLTVKGECGALIIKQVIVYITTSGEPSFTLNPGCDEVLFNGSASTGIGTYNITVHEIDDLGNPQGPSTNVTGGTVTSTNGAVGNYDLFPLYTFVPGNRYRVTLNVTDNCGSPQAIYKDFTHSLDAVVDFTVSSTVCVGAQVNINVAGTYSADEIWVEVYRSNNIGTPMGPVVDITGGWVPHNSPSIHVNPSNLIVFSSYNWYTIKVYARNSCTGLIDEQIRVIRVLPWPQCKLIVAEKCKAEFEFGVDGSGSKNVRFIDKSNSFESIISRTWTFGDGRSSISTQSPTHTYLSDGVYTVTQTIVDYEGCTDTVTKTVEIRGRGTSKRVGQLGTDPSFGIYPNPAKETIYFRYALEDEESGNLNVLNALGQVVYTATLEGGQKVFKLPLINLASGVYYLRFNQENEVLFQEKFVISK